MDIVIILCKAIDNEIGAKNGSVEDLIIAPNKVLSYAIICADSFFGMDNSNLAKPVTRVNEVKAKRF